MHDASSPATTGIQARYQAALDQGQFLIQHCAGCTKHVYFPREICPHCGSDQLALVAPSGLGTVYAVTTVSRKDDAGGDYNVSLIDLDEGVRLMSRVDNCAPADVKIDQRVKARVQINNGQALVVFDALEGGAA
jgi:uncharacterized protein